MLWKLRAPLILHKESRDDVLEGHSMTVRRINFTYRVAIGDTLTSGSSY